MFTLTAIADHLVRELNAVVYVPEYFSIAAMDATSFRPPGASLSTRKTSSREWVFRKITGQGFGYRRKIRDDYFNGPSPPKSILVKLILYNLPNKFIGFFYVGVLI